MIFINLYKFYIKSLTSRNKGKRSIFLLITLLVALFYVVNTGSTRPPMVPKNKPYIEWIKPPKNDIPLKKPDPIEIPKK